MIAANRKDDTSGKRETIFYFLESSGVQYYHSGVKRLFCNIDINYVLFIL